MKGVRGRGRGSRKASKFAPKDVISTMPEEVITNILHCLPLQDAVKTSILSKDWKFKWTMMTQLVFDVNFYNYLDLEETENENHFERIISKLLLHLKGAITKFSLYLHDAGVVDAKVIDSWIICLSKKGIKEFTFECISGHIVLTTHLFSCLELTHLELDNCDLQSTPEFVGFPNLLSLDLSNVYFLSSNCWELLTRSTLVEILKLNLDIEEKVNQVEITKHKNLKVLSLNLCEIENMTEITSSSIFQLVGSFLQLQELSLNFLDCKILADAENRVPASLPHLKTLNLDWINYRNGAAISCAIELIRGFPNLETLSIKGAYTDTVPLPTVCSSEVDFSIMGQLQLLKVKLVFIRGLKNEVSLIKYLLDCSPLLKKMDIHVNSSDHVLGGNNGERRFATKLLKFRRASPLAEIDVFWR